MLEQARKQRVYKAQRKRARRNSNYHYFLRKFDSFYPPMFSAISLTPMYNIGPEQAFMTMDRCQCLLGSHFIPARSFWSPFTLLHKRSQSGRQGVDNGPYLPMPDSTVLFLQSPSDRVDKDAPQWQICCRRKKGIGQKEDTKANWFANVVQRVCASESPGEQV